MTKQAAPVSLEERLNSLRQDRGDAINLDEIGSVVGSLVEGTTQDDEIGSIAAELKELLQFVQSAKGELVSMQPKSLSNRDIPDAAVQLDAVVEATETAADQIMSAADTVSELAFSAAGEEAETLMNVSTQLYEASSFQDLTGQRITKVAKTLTHLEERLNALADAIGDDFIREPEEEDRIEKDDEGVAVNDDDLLNGPQLEGEGNSQDEIDAILAAFD